jgi:hypothetical protein
MKIPPIVSPEAWEAARLKPDPSATSAALPTRNAVFRATQKFPNIEAGSSKRLAMECRRSS